MAEKVALEIDIDAKGASSSLGELEERAEKLNEEMKKFLLVLKHLRN